MTTLDRVREVIRAEVEKAGALEDARRSLERFLLSSIDWTEADGNLTITVHGEEGELLPDRTIQDLISDIRSKRPTLFNTASVHSEAVPGQDGDERAAARGNTTYAPAPKPSIPSTTAAVDDALRASTPAQHSRDWLLVGTSRSASAEPRQSVNETQRPHEEQPASKVDWSIVPKAPVPEQPRMNGVPPHAIHNALVANETAPRLRRGHVLAASVGIISVLCGSALLYGLLPSLTAPEPRAGASAPPQRPLLPSPMDRTVAAPQVGGPAGTGSISTTRLPEPLPQGTLRGVPEVIDTATLMIGGKVAPLFGVQRTSGEGEPAELAGYLRGREVTCLPAKHHANAYRCEVQGQDLSRVVLFNGGGRAASDATPELLAAEADARRSKTGLWAKTNP